MSQPFNEALINNMTIEERMHYGLPINYKDVDDLNDQLEALQSEITDLEDAITERDSNTGVHNES